MHKSIHIIWMTVLLFALAGCGGAPAGSVEIPNNDPNAPSQLETLTVIPPEGWTLTNTGNGLTDGNIVITAMTLSELDDPDAILAGVTGGEHTINGQQVLLQQNLNRLMAWRMVDGTLLTLTMQGRQDAPFTPQQEETLAQIAASISF